MRFSRQKLFLEKADSFPKNFQKTIQKKKIVIVGCGGIGSPLSHLLVRAGFLNIKLIDNDIIDETNLQRQTFYEKDIGNFKSKILETQLKEINKNVLVVSIIDLLDSKNIEEICKDVDLIIDASDNFEIRRIINDYCEKTNKNWLYLAAIKAEFALCLFRGEEKLFSKVFPKKINNEKCCEIGVLSSSTYTCASFALNSILKYFAGIEEKKLIKINLWNYKIFEVNL